MNLQQYNLLKAQILERSFGRLNEMQREAVYTTTGPVLILAGAGSGKTTVIINRIVNLLRFGAAAQRSDYLPRLTEEEEALLCRAATDGTDLEAAGELIAVDRPKPWNVLAITFTNKAAGELRERLTAALGDVGKDVAAATFHSTCVRILRSEIGRLGYSSSFTIYDSDDSLRIIKECMAELNLDEKQFAPRMLMSHISGAKDKLLSAEEMAKVGGDNFVYQTAAKVYTKYQFKLKNANAVDFDDIIILTVKLFQEYPEVLEKYRNRWKYVMVDEYQDTNHIQYLLVSLLAAGHNNVCVVGDDDQSIYKFRGATIENILSFESQFQSTKVIRLEQNYRCTSKILDAANGVISNNLQRKGKTLWTDNDEGESIICFNGTDERREAAYIADAILKNQRDGGATYGDHAVLYRMNAQSGTLEQMFIRKNIPYRIIGGRKFFDRKEIRDVLAYLQVVNNTADDLRMKRIINEPKRGIGDSTVGVAQEIGAMLGISLFEVIKHAGEYAPLSKKANVLMQFAEMLEGIATEAESCSLADTLDKVLERTGYLAAMSTKNDVESQGRLENVAELKTTVLKYIEETDEPTLSGFLEEIALYTDLDGLSEKDDAVIMMTLHSAKGLEFPYVFIAGMEENIFPGQRSIGTPGEIEEERRLAYVGITRAKKRLYITSAAERMFQGRTTRNRRSRFTGEIPPALLEIDDETMRTPGPGEAPASRNGYNGRGFASAIPKPASAHPVKGEAFTLRAGDRVRHYKFGDGKLLSV
ncbi:MAG: 3'-5' exonuclease, partial [Angelakisella sp.]